MHKKLWNIFHFFNHFSWRYLQAELFLLKLEQNFSVICTIVKLAAVRAIVILHATWWSCKCLGTLSSGRVCMMKCNFCSIQTAQSKETAPSRHLTIWSFLLHSRLHPFQTVSIPFISFSLLISIGSRVLFCRLLFLIHVTFTEHVSWASKNLLQPFDWMFSMSESTCHSLELFSIRRTLCLRVHWKVATCKWLLSLACDRLTGFTAYNFLPRSSPHRFALFQVNSPELRVKAREIMFSPTDDLSMVLYVEK